MRKHKRLQPEARGVVDGPRQDHPIAPHPAVTDHPNLADSVSRRCLADAVPLRDRLLWSLADIAALTGISDRHLQRQLSARKMPQCDLRIGRRVLWRPETIRAWLERGGRS